jgi:hypothetical protein
MGAAQVAYRASRKSEGRDRELLTFCLWLYARSSDGLCSRTIIFQGLIVFLESDMFFEAIFKNLAIGNKQFDMSIKIFHSRMLHSDQA